VPTVASRCEEATVFTYPTLEVDSDIYNAVLLACATNFGDTVPELAIAKEYVAGLADPENPEGPAFDDLPEPIVETSSS